MSWKWGGEGGKGRGNTRRGFFDSFCEEVCGKIREFWK